MTTTTLGEFHTLVSDALGRGTSLDSVVPKRVAWAARWLERNYTFQYMRQWKEFEIDVSEAEYPYIISLYDLELKEIELIRRRQLDDDGDVVFGRPLRKEHPGARESRPAGVPESYWLNGLSSIILNSVPDEDMTFEAHIVSFTKWGSASAWTHWLLDNATQLLLCRTLMVMVPRTRDPKLWQTYKAEFDLELGSFNVSEETLQSGETIQVWEPPEYVQHDESLRSA